MDILFSPPNIGALPSSAMAEVEIKTEAMRSSSLQQMLDLERKYKVRGSCANVLGLTAQLAPLHPVFAVCGCSVLPWCNMF